MITDGRAIGIGYQHGGEECVARCRGEVILSAGAINSPQLLQLSGIGPVGKNLQDDLSLDFLFRARWPTLNIALYPFLGKLRAGINYVAFRRGPLALSLNQGGSFVRA